MTATSTTESLPFSNPKQEALFGHIMMDQRFFLLAKTKIKKPWWATLQLQALWEMLLECSTKRPVTVQEFTNSTPFMLKPLDEANSLRTQVNICLRRREEFGLDLLQEDLTTWLQTRIYVETMKKSEALFNVAARGGKEQKAKLVEAFATISAMNREIEAASFEPMTVESMEIEDIEAAKLDSKAAVDFGLPKMNAFLNPDASDGSGTEAHGLLKGDMTVLLAPTNVGKTTTMITVAVVNILSGNHVLIITHEGRVSDIKLKIWQCLMGDDRKTLMAGVTMPAYRAVLQQMRDLMEKHLEFMPLNRAGLTVEEVDAMVRRRVELWQNRHGGRGFDLIIDDYAAKLTTSIARGGNFALRQIHEVVYNYFSQMALEHNAHVLTAIQTNREGSRVNSRGAQGAESRFLTMEDVMESWGPMTTATNVISINRPPEAQAAHVTGFYLCKSRSSEVGVVFLAKSDFSRARSHWPVWDCQEYRLSSGNSERVASLLADFGSVDAVPAA